MSVFFSTPPSHLCPDFSHHAYSLPLHLHSFPTRRSSDLTSAATTCPPTWWPTSVASPRRPPRRRASPSRRCRRSSRDRKSTRLNSSHVAISYAVFCLKKKNLE